MVVTGDTLVKICTYLLVTYFWKIMVVFCPRSYWNCFVSCWMDKELINYTGSYLQQVIQFIQISSLRAVLVVGELFEHWCLLEMFSSDNRICSLSLGVHCNQTRRKRGPVYYAETCWSTVAFKLNENESISVSDIFVFNLGCCNVNLLLCNSMPVVRLGPTMCLVKRS